MDSPTISEQPRITAAPERTVCIVDDDARTAQVLALLLRMDGYEAESCSSARVLARLERQPTPVLLIMSVSMGRGDAVRGVLQVRSSYPSLPLIIITEHPQWVQRLGPLQEQSPTVFTKPVEYPALLLAVATTLAVNLDVRERIPS